MLRKIKPGIISLKLRLVNLKKRRHNQPGVNPDKAEKAVIFLHIPKTAGTALQVMIRQQFRQSGIYELDNKDARRSMDIFKGMADRDKKKFRAVVGHMWFGLHESMPKPCTYITLLREPIDRVVSHYYYVRRMSAHYLHQEVISRNLSLKDYLEQKLSTELNNGQTRLLSGEMDENRYPFGTCPRELLDRAKNNLKEHFSVVGIQERYTDTLRLLEKVFGWKISYFHKNVTSNRPALEDIPRRTIEVIRKYNQLDIELYVYAREIFEEQLNKYLGPGQQN